MCYRTKLTADKKIIEKEFEAKFIDPTAYSPKEEIKVFVHAPNPIITDENQGEIEMFFSHFLVKSFKFIR